MKEAETRVCAICGAEFTTKHYGKKTCSDKCSYELNQINSRESYRKNKQTRKPKRIVNRKLTPAQINEMARGEGLTYGKYVGKYNL